MLGSVAGKEREDGAHWLEWGREVQGWHLLRKGGRDQEKQMAPTCFSKAEEGSTRQPPSRGISQQAPAPQMNTLKLANGLFHLKVWVLFKGLLLCSVLGRMSLCTGPFKSSFSVCHSPRDLGSRVSWAQTQLVFKARCVGGLSLQCRF